MPATLSCIPCLTQHSRYCFRYTFQKWFWIWVHPSIRGLLTRALYIHTFEKDSRVHLVFYSLSCQNRRERRQCLYHSSFRGTLKHLSSCLCTLSIPYPTPKLLWVQTHCLRVLQTCPEICSHMSRFLWTLLYTL